MLARPYPKIGMNGLTAESIFLKHQVGRPGIDVERAVILIVLPENSLLYQALSSSTIRATPSIYACKQIDKLGTSWNNQRHPRCWLSTCRPRFGCNATLFDFYARNDRV